MAKMQNLNIEVFEENKILIFLISYKFSEINYVNSFCYDQKLKVFFSVYKYLKTYCTYV